MKRLFLSCFILSVLILNYLFSQSLKSPEEFLGYRVGSDYKLADYQTIRNYFKHLSSVSTQIRYEEIGKTSLGQAMFMAVISTEENLQQSDKYRTIIRELSDPRMTNSTSMAELAKAGKVIVLVTGNIHSTEVGAAQMSMEFAYNLVSGNGDPKLLKALDNVIFILMPSINPDGLDMVVEWYRKYLNTEYEGSNLPYLYHPYAGHDNNRDWFMFNLVETRNVIKVAYNDWRPLIWLDEHQMGSSGARLFVVPYKDPLNPNVDPLIWRWQKAIGGITALRLEEKHYTGVIDQSIFEGWWEGSASDCGLWHNQISLLSEMASCNIASPVFIDPSEVKATPEITPYDIRTNYPSPWRGGWWKLRDIVDYELELTNALLEFASDHREELLMDYYTMCKRTVDQGNSKKPVAYIIPQKQIDRVTTAKMIEILQLGAVEVHAATKQFVAEHRAFPESTYIIYLAQPNGRYAKDLFEEQRYPDLRKAKSENVIQPYDVAGWTLSYLMGVEAIRIDESFSADVRLLKGPEYPDGFIERSEAKFFIIKAGSNIGSTLINRFLRKDLPIFWLTERTKVHDEFFPPGSIVLENTSKNLDLLDQSTKDLHLVATGVEMIDRAKLKRLKKIRIGLYQPFTANMDEGWTRLLLENFEFEFKIVKNADIKEKKLKNRIDLLILPDMSAEVIKTGKFGGENARFNRPKPPEFEGGIEKEGVENLKSFIESEGGSIIALSEACNFAIEDLGLRVSNVLKNARAEEFLCPGSLLNILVNDTLPIGYGMNEHAIAYQNSNIAFATTIPFGQFDRTVIARYPESNILKSGFLLGEDQLFKKAAIVDVKQKKGHVILFGINVQNRHQTYGTFKMLFNAIHATGME